MGYSADISILIDIDEVFDGTNSLNSQSSYLLEDKSSTMYLDSTQRQNQTGRYEGVRFRSERFMPITRVEMRIGEFGRIYAIDDWIMNNVKSVKNQEGYDIFMEIEEVDELYYVLNRVLVTRTDETAEQNLPLAQFFKNNGYSYDDDYYEGLKDMEIAVKIIRDLHAQDVDIGYIKFHRSF